MKTDLIESRGWSEKLAAKYIGVSVSFLQKDRMNGALPNRTIGPRHIKVGKRVIYLKEELDNWLNNQLLSRL